MIVSTKEKAWEEVNKIFPTDYEKDESSSIRAGYDIYRHPTLNYYSRICDLNDRLEVLTGEYGENVTNIWIEEPSKPALTLKDFLALNNGNAVQVCVKEPDKCAQYWTVLVRGKSNIHTDNDLWRSVYSIGVVHNEEFNGNILMVYVW